MNQRDLYLCIDTILRGRLYITDSTGFIRNHYEEKDIVMKETKVKQTVKLRTAVKYYLRYGVVTGAISHSTAHNSPYFSYLMRRLYGPAILLCDMGYDSEDNRRRAYQQLLIPMIKKRKTVVIP